MACFLQAGPGLILGLGLNSIGFGYLSKEIWSVFGCDPHHSRWEVNWGWQEAKKNTGSALPIQMFWDFGCGTGE